MWQATYVHSNSTHLLNAIRTNNTCPCQTPTHRPYSQVRPLRPVHTSNNVNATLDFVEATFDFVAKTATTSKELIVKYHPFDKVECCFDTVADPRGDGGMAPRHVGKHPECTKSRHFQTQNRKIFWGGAMPPPETPASFPLHKSQRNFQHACFVV